MSHPVNDGVTGSQHSNHLENPENVHSAEVNMSIIIGGYERLAQEIDKRVVYFIIVPREMCGLASLNMLRYSFEFM